jgi:DNA invertase Pin-like site-specific DNA recombinase
VRHAGVFPNGQLTITFPSIVVVTWVWELFVLGRPPVTQNIDPMARFVLHITAAFAELERENIRKRVVVGVKAAKANGKQLGRPKRVFRRDEAVGLREAGMSWRRIAAELGVPVTTVVEGCR